MLIEIGGEHKSGDIHKDQRLQMQDPKVMQMVRENVLSTHHIKDNLLRGKRLISLVILWTWHGV